jgi:hypothetical protein
MNVKLPGSISGAPPPPSPPLQEPAPQASEEDEEEDEGMFTDLLDDGEVEEAATKQRALLALFEKNGATRLLGSSCLVRRGQRRIGCGGVGNLRPC